VVLTALSIGSFLIGGRPAFAKDIQWSGYTWHVRSGDNGGPGPNDWSAENVWIDDQKRLHLKVAHKGNKWSCAEIWSDKRLGFGTYHFDVDSPEEMLDDNVVLGLFNYPTDDLGPDGTNEIDIEYATWGGHQKVHGNFTVWPAQSGVSDTSHQFSFFDESGTSWNWFTWLPSGVYFGASERVLRGVFGIERWSYKPADALKRIPQHPEPVHINLWLFNGKPPTDDKEVEIVISSFRFTPRNGK